MHNEETVHILHIILTGGGGELIWTSIWSIIRISAMAHLEIWANGP